MRINGDGKPYDRSQYDITQLTFLVVSLFLLFSLSWFITFHLFIIVKKEENEYSNQGNVPQNYNQELNTISST